MSNDILEQFKKIDNKIANDYWEYNLNNFDFNIMKKDRDKIMEFIRNKYEYKKWIKINDIDPMQKLIQQNNNNKVYNFNWNYFLTK